MTSSSALSLEDAYLIAVADWRSAAITTSRSIRRELIRRELEGLAVPGHCHQHHLAVRLQLGGGVPERAAALLHRGKHDLAVVKR